MNSQKERVMAQVRREVEKILEERTAKYVRLIAAAEAKARRGML